LIVDDSPAMQRLIARIVALAGLPRECLYASTGREALDLLQRNPVDLILTDINMPVMDGEEFVNTLRADAALREIPVIVLSTDGTRSRVARMAAAGVQAYLSKPFAPEDLRNAMARVLDAA
jgi:two-component system chemotaxis response regulator CheY